MYYNYEHCKVTLTFCIIIHCNKTLLIHYGLHSDTMTLYFPMPEVGKQMLLRGAIDNYAG